MLKTYNLYKIYAVFLQFTKACLTLTDLFTENEEDEIMCGFFPMIRFDFAVYYWTITNFHG